MSCDMSNSKCVRSTLYSRLYEHFVLHCAFFVDILGVIKAQTHHIAIMSVTRLSVIVLLAMMTLMMMGQVQGQGKLTRRVCSMHIKRVFTL